MIPEFVEKWLEGNLVVYGVRKSRDERLLRRIGYRVEEESLIRYAWLVLDRAQNSEPLEQPLLDGVTGLSARYLDGDGEWQENWPPDTVTTTGAEIREVTLTQPSLENLFIKLTGKRLRE